MATDSEIRAASLEEAAHFLRCAGLDWPSPEPAELSAAVNAIAVFRAARIADDEILARYEAARLYLKHIAAGRLPLSESTQTPLELDDAEALP